MNEELRKVRDRIVALKKELLQLKKKEATLSQVSDPPDIVGKYFKIVPNSTFTYYIKVQRVEFLDVFNDYEAIGPSIGFDVRLIGTTVTMRSDSLFSYNRNTWEEITKEDYEKVLQKALTYF